MDNKRGLTLRPPYPHSAASFLLYVSLSEQDKSYVYLKGAWETKIAHSTPYSRDTHLRAETFVSIKPDSAVNTNNQKSQFRVQIRRSPV